MCSLCCIVYTFLNLMKNFVNIDLKVYYSSQNAIFLYSTIMSYVQQGNLKKNYRFAHYLVKVSTFSSDSFILRFFVLNDSFWFEIGIKSIPSSLYWTPHFIQCKYYAMSTVFYTYV